MNELSKLTQRGPLDPETEQGAPLPNASINVNAVAAIIQLSHMQQPIDSTTGLHLVNSMIKGTPIATKVSNWKLNYTAQTRTSRTEQPSKEQSPHQKQL
jgi:hypothetical protein